MEVLARGPTGIRIGPSVAAAEEAVAALTGNATESWSIPALPRSS